MYPALLCGNYMFHCHNLLHEDRDMLLR